MIADMKSNGSEQALEWHWRRMDEMSVAYLYEMLALRESIFVVEQRCVYLELDGLDESALHLVANHKDGMVACLRLLNCSADEGPVRLGRVAVSKRFRGQGLARLMMKKAIEKVRQDYPDRELQLSAQTYLQSFYQSLGFTLCGEEFIEDGIPHLPMVMMPV